MASIFTRIIDGELPAELVYSDDSCVAFMDVNPQVRGHLLVVPREEIDQWTDLPDALRDHLFAVAQRIGRVLPAEYGAPRSGLVIAGYGVPHTHLHVLPICGAADLNPANAAPLAPDELAEDARRVRRALRTAGMAGVTQD